MPLPYHQWYRLVRRNMELAAEVPAARPDRRAWVGVYPRGDSRYHVLYFELEADRVEEADESGDADRYWLNQEELIVTGEDELEATLRRWLEDLERLVQPTSATTRSE